DWYHLVWDAACRLRHPIGDKAVVCWDAAVEKIRTDKQYMEKAFDVCNGDGTTTTSEGCYLLVGYHECEIRMDPSKYPLTENYTLVSKWMESVRKDVGCFLGILICPFHQARLGMPQAGAHRQLVSLVLHRA
ncbi:unnamed protein product, partial [Ectocarpus fasciculatus]